MNNLSENNILSTAMFAVPDISATELISGYRGMVIGRRLDQQATNLAKQGYLTVYPSSLGQEACQVAAAMALGENDWLFPTYRDTIAMISHGVDPVEALTLLRGDWHCGFNPKVTRTAPHATPLATHGAHAVGLTIAARGLGDDVIALVLCGEGATSEGDFHEALNLAAVFNAPVVFLVQNNGYAISVPARKQFRAKSIADKAPGYGINGVEVDGNDFVSTYCAVREAVRNARNNGGPTLIEARTYRIAPHTNSDDPSRYRDSAELSEWTLKDPILRMKAKLEAMNLLDEKSEQDIVRDAETQAANLRNGVMAAPTPDPVRLFANVFSTLPPHLQQQKSDVLARENLS